VGRELQAENTVSSGPGWETAFVDRHRVPRDYLIHAQKWFAPLADKIATHQKSANRALVVGINGSQGSGKTTVCDYLSECLAVRHDTRAVCLSLDDFYLTRHQRAQLATAVHPLLATRGVPGTHDMRLLQATLDALLARDDGQAAVPRFDKARDDRKPGEAWDRVATPLDVILLEGWCLGVRPQPDPDLEVAVNELERVEDADGRWRRYVNNRILEDFEPLYDRIDCWVMLRAPSFDCVYRWRQEQEHKLARSAGANVGHLIMDDGQLARFIQFYERITRNCLDELPARVHHLYQLDEERRVTRETHRESPPL
jgi:D-glycerate 3-kinase